LLGLNFDTFYPVLHGYFIVDSIGESKLSLQVVRLGLWICFVLCCPNSLAILSRSNLDPLGILIMIIIALNPQK